MVNRIKKIACILSLPATAMLLIVSCVADTQENKEMRNHSRGLDEVLHHYKHVDKDSLKYEATVFLLENMPYHYSCKEIIEDSATLEKWRKETDALLTMLQSRYGYDAIPRDKIDSIRLERDNVNFEYCYMVQIGNWLFEVMASYRDVSQRTVRMVNT